MPKCTALSPMVLHDPQDIGFPGVFTVILNGAARAAEFLFLVEWTSERWKSVASRKPKPVETRELKPVASRKPEGSLKASVPSLVALYIYLKRLNYFEFIIRRQVA
ncbi:hypothetical protein DPMN_121515 [Dreissena polymorpha]|uniref:Uncharacterized protein n=1 Tax=Dreissena polymorpha TaxID=45954 RepID=A0A9D4JPL3_DREPO|nr:hypothetical protein DPMN_121515 [Dreissena polymorpha]